MPNIFQHDPLTAPHSDLSLIPGRGRGMVLLTGQVEFGNSPLKQVHRIHEEAVARGLARVKEGGQFTPGGKNP
jgi:hypothetical protein